MDEKDFVHKDIRRFTAPEVEYINEGIIYWLQKRQKEALYDTRSHCEIIEVLIKEVENLQRVSYDFPWSKQVSEIRVAEWNAEKAKHPCKDDNAHIMGWSECHFCGTTTCTNGYEWNDKRHWLSDCRPDLVEHAIGDKCTWFYRRKPLIKDGEVIEEALPENQTCYAYQEGKTWTNEHTHFYPDGPC